MYQKLVTRLRYGLVRCAVGIWPLDQRDGTVTAWAGVGGQRDTSPPPAAPVTNWERQCVTLAGYCYAMRHGMKVQLVTPYCVSLLQRYGVTVHGNVTSVYPPLKFHKKCEICWGLFVTPSAATKAVLLQVVQISVVQTVPHPGYTYNCFDTYWSAGHAMA